MNSALRLTLCLGLLCALPLQAQLRTIPADAYRADMIVGPERKVKLDGTIYTLSIGAQIFNTQNMIVQPQALSGGPYSVRLQLNEQKEVRRVWLLTQTEADAPGQPKLETSISLWRRLF